ncbi:hypothetical protein NW762_011293 [Fusarium torreyae]|uniref:Uncharacterized protein n=1 Tax=Fusarium torreyae TaxID=1237075 RepID=A0A9W8RQ38_9HYPO|nr:hypothetical protein NW762_011293 [Fusarium torreyae]
MVNRPSPSPTKGERSLSKSPRKNRRHHPYDARSRSQTATTSTQPSGPILQIPTPNVGSPPGFAGVTDNVTGFPPQSFGHAEVTGNVTGAPPPPSTPYPAMGSSTTLGSTSGRPVLNPGPNDVDALADGFGALHTPTPHPPRAVMTSTTASGSAPDHFGLNPEAASFTASAHSFMLPPPTPAPAHAELHRAIPWQQPQQMHAQHIQQQSLPQQTSQAQVQAQAQAQAMVQSQLPVGYDPLGIYQQQQTQQQPDLQYLDNSMPEQPAGYFLTGSFDNLVQEQSEVQHEPVQHEPDQQQQSQHSPGPEQGESFGNPMQEQSEVQHEPDHQEPPQNNQGPEQARQFTQAEMINLLPPIAQLRFHEEMVVHTQMAFLSHRPQLQLQPHEFQRRYNFMTRAREYFRQQQLHLLYQQDQQQFNEEIGQ